MIDPELFRQIDAEYRPTLQNLDVPHPRLMILFSGPPSSGKSTVAEQLEEHFKGLRIRSDSIRTILTALRPKMRLDEMSKVIHEYYARLLEELADTSPNGLWIIDSSTDRTYDPRYEFAHKHGFKIVLLAMCIPENLHREWIVAGGDRPFNSMQDYLKMMPQRREEQERFLRNHTPDMTIEPDYFIEDIYKLVALRIPKT